MFIDGQRSSNMNYATADLHIRIHMRVIPKVSDLGTLDNNIFYNLYISEMYILYEH